MWDGGVPSGVPCGGGRVGPTGSHILVRLLSCAEVPEG